MNKKNLTRFYIGGSHDLQFYVYGIIDSYRRSYLGQTTQLLKELKINQSIYRENIS